MNKISIRNASNTMRDGMLIASHSPAKTAKSKNLTYHPYNNLDEQYVIYYIDESGEGEPIEMRSKTKCLATAVSVYNDYEVEE